MDASALDQIRRFIEGLEPGQRRSMAIVTLLSFVGLLALGFWANQDQYVTILRSSDINELNQARAALEEQGIAHQVDESGLAILAPREDLGRARIASAGRTRGLGLESLSELELGATPQRERWAYQRALQGELERTIDGLAEVASSRVHLVLQQRSSFLRDDPRGTASVTVHLKPGASLSRDQVRGITALVAGAIDGIEPQDVTLVDHTGRLLSQETDPASVGISGIIEAQTALEQRTQDAIQDALIRILGSGDALSVAVTAELETSQVERTTNRVDPNSQATLSEQLREEDRTGRRTQGGVPGTAANLAAGGNQAVAGKEEERNFSQIATNYDYTRTQERERRTAGSLRRLSVAVTIDQKTLDALVGPEGDGTTLQTQIQQTIQAAMGFDAERGDLLNVAVVPFAEVAPMEEVEVAEGIPWAELQALAPSGVAGLAVVFFFVWVVRPLMQQVKATSTPSEPPVTPEQPVAAVGDEEPNALAQRLRSLVDDYEQPEAEEVNKLVELEEDASAEVVRRWIRAA